MSATIGIVTKTTLLLAATISYRLNLSLHLERTFAGYNCLTLHYHYDDYRSDAVQIFATNFLRENRRFKFTWHNNNHYYNHEDYSDDDDNARRRLICDDGYFLITDEIENVISFVNKSFDKVPRIMLVVFSSNRLEFENPNEIEDFYQGYSNLFADKELLSIYAQSEKRFHILRKTRHQTRISLMSKEEQEETYFPAKGGKLSPGNYHKRSVTAVTFNCPIFAAVNKINDNEYELMDGVEVRILREIVNRLNLTLKITVPSDGKKWGTRYPNGTSSGGIIKYLETGRADIGFCSLWIEATKYQSMILSTSWTIICLKFLLPKPKLLSLYWASIFKPLPSTVWILTILSAVSTFAASSGITYVNLKMTNRRKGRADIGKGCVHVIGMLVLVNNPVLDHKGKSTNHRQLFLWWSVFALIFANIYSSSLVSHLTYPQYSPMMTTIRSLVKAGYYWGTPYEPPIDHLFDLNNSWHREFVKRFEYERTETDRPERILSGRYASLTKCIGNKHFTETDNIPTDLLYTLRSTRNCLNYFFLAFGFRKGLAYIDEANIVISRLLESGITDYWLNRISDKSAAAFSKVYEYREPIEKKETNVESLTLKHLQGVFYLWIFGIGVSCVQFLYEKRSPIVKFIYHRFGLNQF